MVGNPRVKAPAPLRKPRREQVDVRAGESSPAVNPAFVVRDWGEMDCELKINGETIERGKDFRSGHVPNSEGTDLVLWVKFESKDTVKVEIFREKW